MTPEPIANRIDAIYARIAAAARRAGRAPQEVRLVGVTKTHPPEVIAEAIAAGLRDLGENRVQEAERKIPALSAAHPGLTWHLIGHLQTNKARRAAALFDVVHSLDGARLAVALDRHVSERMKDEGGRMNESRSEPHPSSVIHHPLPVLLQVNVSGEASKSGVAPGEAPALCRAVAALPQLRLRGLMTIPEPATAADAKSAAVRRRFAQLRELRDELNAGGLNLDTLSMGMSHDLEEAIMEGATIVRVGTAIFGERVKS